jgi:hypothetical protein
VSDFVLSVPLNCAGAPFCCGLRPLFLRFRCSETALPVWLQILYSDCFLELFSFQATVMSQNVLDSSRGQSNATMFSQNGRKRLVQVNRRTLNVSKLRFTQRTAELTFWRMKISASLATVSATFIALLLLFILVRTALARRRSKTSWHPETLLFLKSHLGRYTICLLVANLISSVAASLNFLYPSAGRITGKSTLYSFVITLIGL